MKTRLIILGLFLAALFFWWLLHNSYREQSAILPPAIETNQSTPPTTIRQIQTSALTAVATSPAPMPESNFTALAEQRRKQMDEALEKAQEQWRTPIEFYGKVVDQDTNPVAGAHIDFDCNDTSPTGTSFYNAESDESGLFAIRDIKGKLLGVKVNKAGYYAYQPYGADFYYAGQNQNFVPDAGNPVIFRLKKKGIAERLIRFDKGFDVPRDGTSLEVQLANAKAVALGQGDLRVQCWTDDQGKKPGQDYDWKCQITVPGGGLLQRTDNLNFQAPLDGYQPSDVIDMPASLGNRWTSDVKRNYFLKLADRNYARISFEMIAGGEHFFRLETFLNPSGSRNLEFDPNNVISGGN
jgi:hypothetical protein